MRWPVVFFVVTVFGCVADEQLNWRVRAAEGVDSTSIIRLGGEVRRGGCEGPVLIETDGPPAGAMAPDARLPPGRYGFFNYAVDAECRRVGEGCIELELPENEVNVTLSSTSGVECTLDECVEGVCANSTTQPPQDQDLGDGEGRLRTGCGFSHQQQVDPIVSPMQTSEYMNDFFGNTSTSAVPDYEQMLSGSTSCSFSENTAAYWLPALKAPSGGFVTPDGVELYYRARPLDYRFGTNYFPPNFMMVAGGLQAPDTAAYWTCDGESDTGYADRKIEIPDCRGVQQEWLIAHVFFPSCWDGENIDSDDHRKHVTYGLDGQGNPSSSNSETCPASHPYKLPQLDLRVTYPIKDGTGHAFANGSEIPQASFWNTWQQDALESLINDCLRTGTNCGGISD